MKKNKLIHFLLTSFILFQYSISYAQEPGKWGKPAAHPCFQGIMISVVNMGKGSGDNDFLWGVKFTNNYATAVTFRYKLSIGEKVTSKYGGEVATLGRKDDPNKKDTWIDGGDKFTAKLYHNSSEEWYLYIWDVCFDGMRCGGADGCYAECDRDKDEEHPKPNQPCGLSSSPSLNAPEINNEPKEMSGTLPAGIKKKEDETPDIGETSNWKRDDGTVEVNMGKTAEGIYWKRKQDKQYSFLKKLPDGSYVFDAGKDFYSLKFASATKVGFYKNNVLENYYTLDGAKEEDDGESKVRSGLWEGNPSKIKITVTKEGLIFHSMSKSFDDGSPFYKRISATEYRRYEPDGILFYALKLQEDGTLQYSFTDKPGSYFVLYHLTFLSADEEKKITKNNQTLSIPKVGEWKTKEYDEFRRMILITDNNLIMSDKGVTSASFLTKTDANTYEVKYKTGRKEVIKFNGNTMFNLSSYNNSYDTLPTSFDFVLVSSEISEKKPTITSQGNPSIKIVGKWNYMGLNFYSELQLEATGDNLSVNFWNPEISHGYGKYNYIKNGQFIYTNKTDSTTSTLKYLNDTTLSISYQYKNLNTLSYYTRPAAAPIVKQEDKPVTVTENKTASEECSDLNGKWKRTRINDQFSGVQYLTIKTTTYGLMVSYADFPNPLFKKISSSSYKWAPTREEYAGGYQLILRCQSDGSIRMYQYRADGSDVGGYEEFIKK